LTAASLLMAANGLASAGATSWAGFSISAHYHQSGGSQKKELSH
jgi:hypothetical protein